MPGVQVAGERRCAMLGHSAGVWDIVTQVMFANHRSHPQVLGSSSDYCDSCTVIHEPFMRVLSFARLMGCQISCLLVPDPSPMHWFQSGRSLALSNLWKQKQNEKEIEIIWNNRITVQNLYILETVVMSTAVCQAETVDPQSQERKCLLAYWHIESLLDSGVKFGTK